MFTFVFGFLGELAKETGAWLDRILPLPGVRRPLRHWRRRRPFWAGVWTSCAGLWLIFLPFAPLPLMLRVGVGAISAVAIGLVLIAGGLFFVFAPHQRMFISVVTAIASLTSLATTNLGGLGIGVGLGLFGSSMAFGWMPDPPASEEPQESTPVGEVAAPKAGEGRRAYGRPALSLAMPVVLTATLTVALPQQRASAVERCDEPVPTWPLTGIPLFPWDKPAQECATGSGSDDRPGTPPRPAKEPGLKGPMVGLPCLTGIDTGDLDNADPGEIGEPDDLSALKPPIVLGRQPGRPRATYPVSPRHPRVNATRLEATDAIIHGSTYLKTAEGRIKVLWVHAKRIVATDYHLELDAPRGRRHVLDVQLDIRDVDVYATYLRGSIEIPGLKVKTPRICIGADVIPANLPVAVRLPKLSLEPVEAGQVLVDTADVRYRDLKTRIDP
ncbi:DUF6114 domain-containing protein [Streptomyces gobiensis]|uniref:DUF6114 domain-containing protein n=1 Tax=Streptomyces gobiensis TaxID=2875706 RepID=UPI001E2E4203|nr:DUF6114 domain-containing protein [Streptomyces gobiensis]UGY94477.1 DUF6114 domain-containing protein [Streptomyces gobiensis]